MYCLSALATTGLSVGVADERFDYYVGVVIDVEHDRHRT